MSESHQLDAHRTARLDDVGAAGYLAATVVTEDGQQMFALANASAVNDPAALIDFACREVAHEQLGPLPIRWMHRVALAPARCGRATKAGRPCRTLVSEPGGPCPRHRATATNRTLL
jgi:hypothetical protein